MKKSNEKRLLKDLPFENLKAGTVIIKRNSGYEVPSFPTYYDRGGSSGGSTQCIYVGSEKDIIDTVWDNEAWFEEATLEHIDIVLGRSEIKLCFKPLSAEKANDLAQGIAQILKHLDDGSYVWNGMGGVTTKVKNH